MPNSDGSTTSNVNPIVNPIGIDSQYHPLYFHPADHPGLILVSKKLSGSSNYNTWRKSMRMALSAKYKIKLVNGEFPRPGADDPLATHWDRENDMVMSWILNTLCESIANSMTFANSAQEIWNKLSECYSIVDAHKYFQLEKSINQLSQSENSVEYYYRELNGLWDEIDMIEAPLLCQCACTNEHRQRKRLMIFLMGLNDSYIPIRGQILLMNPLPSVTQAYGMISQEERQRQVGVNINPAIAAAVNRSYYPRQNSTTQNSGMKTSYKPAYRKGTFCSYCRKEGHIKDECFKLVGFPIGHPLHDIYKPKMNQGGMVGHSNGQGAGVSQSSHKAMQVSSNLEKTDSSSVVYEAKIDTLQNQVNQLMVMMQSRDLSSQKSTDSGLEACHMAGTIYDSSFVANVTSSSSKDHTWIIDTGATDHICIDKSNFSDMQELVKPISLSMPNGNSVKVSSSGTVNLINGLSIHGVLYVPTFGYNLLSVQKLLHQYSYKLIFSKDSCVLQDQTQKIEFCFGQASKGLYILQGDASGSIIHTAAAVQSDSLSLWHRRLGHSSFQAMMDEKRMKMVMEDRISNLPSHLIQHILTFTPLKDVVRTSILSSTWRYMWASCPKLLVTKDFYEDNFKKEPFRENGSLFFRVVKSIVLRHVGHFQAFHLYFPNLPMKLMGYDVINESILSDMLCITMKDVLVESLCIENANDDASSLPDFAYFCVHVRDLKLSNFRISPRPQFGLCNLERVCLSKISFRTNKFEVFIKSARVLTELILINCDGMLHLRGDAPCLKTLKVHSSSKFCVFGIFGSTPSLRTVSLTGTRTTLAITKYGKTANLTDILCSMPKVRSLTLSGGVIKELTAGRVPQEFPTLLKHLRHLKLRRAPLVDLDWISCIFWLLRCSPKLRIFVIESSITRRHDVSAEVVEFLESKSIEPLCRLQVVEFSDAKCSRDEVAFIKVLLAKTPLLRKMKINMDVVEASSFKTEILGFPRASTTAEVTFT